MSLIKKWQEAEKAIQERVGHITNILEQLEETSGESLSGYDSWVVGCTDAKLQATSNGKYIYFHWEYVEEYEDWNHPASLIVPRGLFDNGSDGDIEHYFKLQLDKQRDEEKERVARELKHYLDVAVNHYGIDISGFVKKDK